MIDALEPDAETINVSWKYPGNEKLLFWTVNLIVGGAFVLQAMIGILNPESHSELILPLAIVGLIMALIFDANRRYNNV